MDIDIDYATATRFIQDVGCERRLVDFLEASGAVLPTIANRLDRKGYRYGRHVMPHNADYRERGSGQSCRWRGFGVARLYA